jgi:bifunctional DNA-binding transcriptional regulator/antitoxin component of YhaV-PrlF toxin-antitoxin module
MRLTVAIKNNNRTPLVVPPAVRRKAGFRSGEEIEFRASGGVITIMPKLPSGDEEYTPAQRRIIDAQLAEGLADIKAGRTYGPFNTADEMISHMKAHLKKRKTAKKAKRA